MGMRLLWTIAAVGLAATTASAQTGLRSASLPDRTPTNPTAVPPMSLPSASLPARTPDRPIPPDRLDLFMAGPDTYKPFVDERGRPIRRFFPFGYGYGYASETSVPMQRQAIERQGGYLHLQLQPGTAQVYVDGFYMGSVDDFRRMIPGRSLEAGAHRVEVRAPGYEARSFDVLIPPNDTVSYRTDLEPVAGAARVAATPGVPKTFYVIPGCYAGDKPPRSRLPVGCDRSKLRTIAPDPVFSVKR